jgi:hypothetical protein
MHSYLSWNSIWKNVDVIDSYLKTYSNIILIITGIVILFFVVKYFITKRKKQTLKFLFAKQEFTSDEKKERRNDRLLLILSGILFGISFVPFPFPFTLLLFVAFVPYFFVVTKKQTLLKVNSASYLTFFVMSLVTVFWVGSWQSAADPFLMISGVVLVFFLPCVMLINSTLYFLSRKVFKKDLSLYFFSILLGNRRIYFHTYRFKISLVNYWAWISKVYFIHSDC